MKLTTKIAKRLIEINKNLKYYKSGTLGFQGNFNEKEGIINFKNELKEISEKCNLNYKFSEEMFTLRVLKLIKEIESIENGNKR